MDIRVKELIYEDNIEEVLSMIDQEKELIPVALRWSVRYDRILLLSSMMKRAREFGYISSTDTVESVRSSMTSSIIDDSIRNDDKTTINSMIYTDVLNVYLVLERSVMATSFKFYSFSLSKIEENNLTIDGAMWMNLVKITANISSVTNSIFADILNHKEHLDMTKVGKLVIDARSSYKLDMISSHKKSMDVNYLLVYSMRNRFNSGVDSFLYSVDKKNVDEVMKVAVEEDYIDVVDTLITSYKGDITSLTLLSIEKKNIKIYNFLLDFTSTSSYTDLCVTMVKSRMYDQMFDLLVDIKDFTPILVEIVREDEIDMLDVLLDMEPETVDFLPILYQASLTMEYNRIRDILFSYGSCRTPTVEAFDMIVSKGDASLPTLRKSKDVDLQSIKQYVREMGLYNIDRYISFSSKYG